MRVQTLTYLLPLLLLVSAYSGDEKQSQQSETKETQQQQKAQAQTDDVRTIDIIGIDRMKYVVKEEGELLGTAESIKASNGETYLLLQDIEAEAGQKLRIRLTTVSNLPASAMAHNWILLKMGVDPAEFADVAAKAKRNEYIPQDRTDDIIAHTGLAAGGETVEVTFTVPEKTGEYDYLCSFPGHFAAGMKGKLIVQ
jgi:azurin